MHKNTLFIVFIITVLTFAGCTTSRLPPDIKISAISKDDKKLEAVLRQIGVREAMAQLVKESAGGSKYDCHQQAHHIGRVGYAVEKEKAFGACDPSCHSGCYHGAMESFLHEKGTANLAQNIDSVCAEFTTQFGNFECLHGVGHGVLAYVDYDMPEAINECNKLRDGFGQSSCYGGMFMENILTGQGLGASTKQDHETTWVNRTDALFPCNKIDQSYAVQFECYQMQTSWMLTMYNYDFDRVSAECKKAPADFVSVCYKSFGRDAAGHTLRNPQKILDICNKVPREKDYYRMCAMGAVNVIVDFWGPGLKGQASELCALFKGDGADTCWSVLASRLPNVFAAAADQQKICDTFEPEYQHLCRNGAAETPALPGPSASREPSPPAPSPVSNSTTIEMTENGFSPTRITIQKGQTVTFKNVGREMHWPASNIHPTHSIYPEFDPKRGIAAGELWSFTFDKIGSWRFHDHLYPNFTGVVTVE